MSLWIFHLLLLFINSECESATHNLNLIRISFSSFVTQFIENSQQRTKKI